MAMHHFILGTWPAPCRAVFSRPGEVPLAELEVGAQISRIARASAQLTTRINALRNVAERATATAKDLEEQATQLAARRQADGSIKLFAQDANAEIWQMGAAAAAALRDQLDVALHVPAPDQPIDPPSKL
jgi:hypothetical protein